MTKKVRNLCIKIENLMDLHKDRDFELLYEKIIDELQSVSYSGIFIQLNNIPLYRVRLNNEMNDIFKRTKDLHYAPSENVSNYGRVNRIGQSMFYCSESSTICDLELLYDYLLKNDIGHERLATYSEWGITKDLNILILAMAPSKNELSNGITIRNECFKFVNTFSENDQKDYSNFYSLTSHFFLKNAKEDYKVYVVCSAIANYFTLQFPDIDGLLYPSVQGISGYNIALRPHVIDRNLIVPKSEIEVKKWVVSNKNLMSIDGSFNKKGNISGEEIKWSE